LPLHRWVRTRVIAHASQGITAEHRARQQRQRDQAGGSGAATPIDLDADESETPAPAPVPAEPVASTSKAKSKKRKKAEDADTELVLNTSKAKKSSFADRTPGKFTMCALCSSSASCPQASVLIGFRVHHFAVHGRDGRGPDLPAVRARAQGAGRARFGQRWRRGGG